MEINIFSLSSDTALKMIENEHKIVKRLAKGNILAFNTLYKEYSWKLFRFALGYLKSEAEAEDLVQEVFTIIWRKKTDLRDELSFKSYIFTISFNVIRRHFRSKVYLSEYIKRSGRSEEDFETSEKITTNSLNNYISDLVNQLPERRKEIFIKSRFEGQSIKEISNELKISHKTVENQLTSALRFLRLNLKKENLPIILFILQFIS